MNYQLLDKFGKNLGNKKGEFYLQCMHCKIANEEKDGERTWAQLKNIFLGELPNNKPFKPNTPSLKQWSDNHLAEGWVLVEQGKYRSPKKVATNPIKIRASLNPIPHESFVYHEYSDFSEEFKSWFECRNTNSKWKGQLDIISYYQFDFQPLDGDGIFYTDALFFLLGFNPKALERFPFFINFDMLGYRKNTFKDYFREWLITNTPEAKLLSKNPDFQKELIPLDKFKAWAKDRGFLEELGERKLSKKIEEELHRLLIKAGLINECQVYEQWQWIKADVLLRYLIVELRHSGIIPTHENPFDVIIEPYISQKGVYNLKNKAYHFDRAPQGALIINSVINDLKTLKK